MSSYLNRILYHHTDLAGPYDLTHAHPFMLTKEFKHRSNEVCHDAILHETINADDTREKPLDAREKPLDAREKPLEPIQEDTKRLISPKQQDSLFWCLYIIEHGYKDYIQITHQYGIKELEEKQKTYEFVKNNTSLVKNTNYKMTGVAIQEMLSELIVVQKNLSFLSLIATIVRYNINILIVMEEKNCMLEFWCNKERIPNPNSLREDGDAATYVIYKTKYGKYKLQEENISSYKLQELRDSYVVLESYNKILKAQTNYKVDDLEVMARKLYIITGTEEMKIKYKKGELYDKIIETIGTI